MSKFGVWFWRTGALITILALALGAFEAQPVHAEQPTDVVAPPAPSGERLERLWARQQRVHARLGHFFENADGRIANAQNLIERAKATGKEVPGLQAALDAFSDAVKQARPVYEGGKGIVSSHQGFDEAGKVTDFPKAVATVRGMGAKLREIRQILWPTLRGLRQAVREFRQVNRPLPTPTPGGA